VITYKVRFIGIDPDLHNTGWAMVTAEWTTPRTAATKYTELSGGLLSVKSSLRGLDAANASITRLAELITPYDFDAAQPPVLVAEGQQVYPDPDADRAEIIGKANDLLMLAQVTGAALGIAIKRGCSAHAVLPRTWKGQKKKEPHQLHLLSQVCGLGLAGATLDGHLISKLPQKYNHAMDAVGIALWAAEQASMGLLAIQNTAG
jgi:Holliday junction resolvasome RuvABC endonuclease subunit